MREFLASVFLTTISLFTLFPMGLTLWAITSEEMEDQPYIIRLLSYVVSWLFLVSPIWIFFLTGWIVKAIN